MDVLWKEYFTDPSAWVDNRLIQVDEMQCPSWVFEELRRKEIKPSMQGKLEKDNGEEIGVKNYIGVSALVASLKACTSKNHLHEGIKLHNYIQKRFSLQKNPFLVISLINMYAKCGAFPKAQKLIEEFPTHSQISWNALIAGYVQHGKAQKALNCLEQMKESGLSPDGVTFICILKACCTTGDIEKGKLIHEKIIQMGLLQNNVILGNALIAMYAKGGMLANARQLHEELLTRNVVSWSTLISGYSHHGQGQEALDCFQRMKNEALFPNSVTFICILSGCGGVGAIEKGKQIHEEIMSRGLMHNDVVLGNALVDMYAKCSKFLMSQGVLDELPVRNAVSWNALIAGYVHQGQSLAALNCFECMQAEGLSPGVVTFTCILKACSNIGDVEIGKQIHGEVVKRGLLEKDVLLGTALIDMYATCNVLTKARNVLEQMPSRNVACWSALMAGYTKHGQACEALNCFRQMQDEGFYPDVVTFICILKACSITGSSDMGKTIHEITVNRGFIKKNIALGNALMDMYVKCGMLERAESVLEELPVRDVVSWSTLILGYVQQEQGSEALSCLERMQCEGLSPDAVAMVCILKACGSIGAVDAGNQLYNDLLSRELLEKNIVVDTTLVGMYAKAGVLQKAKQVLEELPVRDSVSWNSLITGYAQQGQARQALNCLEQMQNEGISPDEVTFLSVLSACNHSGLLEEAQMLFRIMTRNFSIRPIFEHHNCMALSFGCAGYFDEAMWMIKVTPYSAYPALWLALLGACRKWGNLKLGRLIFDQIVQLDVNCAASYVRMVDIFVAAGMKQDANRILSC